MQQPIHTHNSTWRYIMIIVVMGLLTLVLSACEQGFCPDRRSWTIPADKTNDMVGLLNEARIDAGLDPLTYDGMLGLVASEHSKDMACRNFFSHINPEDENPADRVPEAGDDYLPPYIWISENIGTYTDTTEQFESWMASEDHRDNILDDRVDEVGIGIIHIDTGSDYTDYWTAVFLGRHR